MRRILFHASLAFALGAVWPPLLPHSLSPYPFLIVSLCILLVSWFSRTHQRAAGTYLLLALFFSGSTWTLAYLQKHAPAVGPWLGKPLLLEGEVVDMPVKQGQRWAFPVQVNKPFEDIVWIKSDSAVPWRKGDILQIKGELQEPAHPRNPGGFDEAKYLYRKGAHAVLQTAEGKGQVRLLQRNERFGGRSLFFLERRLQNSLHALFPPQEAALLAGMLFGWTEEMDQTWYELFSLLGLTHLLAASGANVALAVAPLWWILQQCRLSPPLRLVLVLPAIILFVMLAGMSPSVVRAGIMTALYLLGKVLGRPVDALTLIGISGWAEIMADPLILWHLGFQLSYGVTLGLVLFTPPLYKGLSLLPLPQMIRRPLAATLAAELVSVPLLLFTFHVYTPLSLLANLYAIPFVSLLVPCGFILLMVHWLIPPLAMVMSLWEHGLLYLFLTPLRFLGEKRWGLSSFAAPPAGILLCYYAGLFFLLCGRPEGRWARKHIRPLPFRLFSTAMVLSYFFFLFQPDLFQRDLQMTFLDVGQGDAICIRTPSRRVILVDGGGRMIFKEGFYDEGEKVVVPYLRQAGVREIDLLILSHPDQDHMMGLFAVLQSLPVKALLLPGFPDESPAYAAFLKLVQEKNIPVYLARKGITWEFESGLFLHLYNPPDPFIRGTRADLNANSIVFELDYGRRSFLFTGDLEGEAETAVQPLLHPVDILKVSHHGSKFSTSESFLQAVHPSYAIVSVGKNNRYGHPAPETLQRLRACGAQVLRTDESGAIIVQTDGDDMTVKEMKTSNE